VTGANFGNSESVRLYWDSTRGVPLSTALTDGSGSFGATVTAPESISGTHTIIALGLRTFKLAMTAITIQPEVLVAPSSGHSGSQFVATGYGFNPAEPVSVYWDKPLTLLGSTTSGARGSFSGVTAVTGTVPLSATSGLHLVFAVGAGSRASTLFTVH
jgi:hypothetical protein